MSSPIKPDKLHELIAFNESDGAMSKVIMDHRLLMDQVVEDGTITYPGQLPVSLTVRPCSPFQLVSDW